MSEEQSGWAAVAANKGDLTLTAGVWVILKHTGEEHSSGKGLNALTQALVDNSDQVLFAAIKVNGVDVQENLSSVRPKIVRLNWVGPKVRAMAKVQALSGRAKCAAILTGAVCEIDCEKEDEISMLDIGKTLLGSGGAHKPVYYDFGDDKIDVEALTNQK